MDSLEMPKQLVIAAGGKGTRMYKDHGALPKALIPINGIPVVERLILKAKENKMTKVLILLSDGTKAIEDYLKDGENFGIKIDYSYESVPLGTGGSLINAKDKLESVFYYAYADVVMDIDFMSMARFHYGKGSELTLFVHPNDHPHDSDIVRTNSEARVIEVIECPHEGSLAPNLVNAAFYIVEKKILERAKDGKTDFIKGLLKAFLAGGKAVYAYKSREYIKDMGTPERKAIVEGHLSSGHVENRKLTNKIGAIFLDRDGTVIKWKHLLSRPEDVELIPGVQDAIRTINTLGKLAILVTNQPVVARGLCTTDELNNIHDALETMLGREGAYFDDIYYCPHHPDSGFEGEVKSLKIECSCRKPQTGMIDEAVRRYNVDLKNSWFIGDSTVDLMTARNSNIKSVLVETGVGGRDGKYKVDPDIRVNQLSSELIESIHKHK